MGRWRRTALVIATATLGFVSAADPALARDSGCRAHAAKRDSGCVPDRMSGTINGSNDNFSWTGVVTMDDREPSVAGTIDVHWQLSGSARAENADLDEGCVPLKTEGSATVEVRMTWEEDPLDEDQWDYYIDSNTIDPDVEYECKHGRSSIEGINLIVPIAVGNGKTRALSSV